MSAAIETSRTDDDNDNNMTGLFIAGEAITTATAAAYNSTNNHSMNYKNNKNPIINRDINNTSSFISLEKQLFQLLKQNHVRNPTVKEFKECWAFAKAIQPIYYTRSTITSTKSCEIKIILDVAGGHGTLGAILLILFPSVTHAIVIDPAVPSKSTHTRQQDDPPSKEQQQQQEEKIYTAIQHAWRPFLIGPNHNHNNSNNNSMDDDDDDDMRLIYRSECLFTALPNILQSLLFQNSTPNLNKNNKNSMQTNVLHPSNILVVACHACQHLSEETIQIAYTYGVHVAVMPCCQKDHVGSFKAFAKLNHIPFDCMMDILLAGKCQSWMRTHKIIHHHHQQQEQEELDVVYQVKMRTIDSSITPQNRLITCKAQYNNHYYDSHSSRSNVPMKYTTAHKKLQLAYTRAHDGKKNNTEKRRYYYYDCSKEEDEESNSKVKKKKKENDKTLLLCKPIQELFLSKNSIQKEKQYQDLTINRVDDNDSYEGLVYNKMYSLPSYSYYILMSVFIVGLILGSILSIVVVFILARINVVIT